MDRKRLVQMLLDGTLTPEVAQAVGIEILETMLIQVSMLQRMCAAVLRIMNGSRICSVMEPSMS